MKKVHLIRHALPDFPGGDRMCLGTTDIPLGGAGLNQAAELARKLPAVTAVFSSPLTRAVQTAQAIGLPVTVIDDLREQYAGQWDGLTFTEIRQRFPELYAARARDLSIPPPDAEDDGQALVRFTAAMEQAAALSPGDLAVVAHGGVIALFLQQITGIRYKPDYAEALTLLWKDGIFYTKDSVLP